MRLTERRSRDTGGQHIIADLSVNHVERAVLDEGHTVQRFSADYGYDLVLVTFDHDGYAENGLIFLQLKASESLRQVGENYVYDLDIRDYNLWIAERFPIFLVLYDAGTRRAYWLHVQGYFRGQSRSPKWGAKTVRVRVPQRQRLTRAAVTRMRTLRESEAIRIAEGRRNG